MSEQIIALRIRLDGSKESAKKVNTLTKELNQIGKQMDLLRKKGDQLKTLQDQLGKGKLSNTSPSSGGNARAPRAPQSTNLNSSTALRNQISEARAANVSVDALIQRVGKLKAEQTEVNKQIRLAARAFEETKAAAGSYREINAQLVKARDNYRQLGKEERNSIGGADSLNRIKTLDRELKKLDADMGVYARNVGNYGDAFSKIGGIAARTFGVIGIALSADQIVADAAKVSDSISNVQKVAFDTTEQARALSDQLALRDTRTSLNDQLAIAETGGRLGINTDNLGIEEAQKQLLGFTDAIDTANVALGDQFDNDAQKVASTLAGLRNVLTDFRPNGEADIGDDLLRIGNALNYLETQGNSTAPVIADFVNRIGGSAVPLDASTESIFALSATLDELEINAERGATAVTKTLSQIAAAPEKFAKEVVDAGLIESSEKFTKLVNDDIIGALVLLAKSTQEGSSTNTEFAQALQELEINGVRAQEVFGKLGGASDRYNELLGKSEKALSETTSLLAEFAAKNDNLAGDLAKTANQFVNAFASGEVQDGLRFIVQSISQLVAVLFSAVGFVVQNYKAILLLAAAYVVYDRAAIASRLDTLRLAAAQKASGVIAKATAIQQRLLNVALNANPIGLVVTAVLLLVGAFTLLYKNSETVRNAINGLGEGIANAYKQSGLLKAVLDPTVTVLRFLYDIVTGNAQAIDRFKDSIETLKDNAPAFLEIVKLKFQQLGLSVREAFSFGGASERLNERINDVKKAIEAQQQFIDNNNKQLAEREIARGKTALKKKSEQAKEETDLLTEEERKRRAALAALASKSELERVKAKVAAGKDLTEAEQAIFNELSSIDKKRLKDQAKRREQAIAAAKARREQEAKDRLTAAKRILDLENDLISNRFDQREAKASTNADREIAALVGDPEQVKTQADLIRKALNRELSSINDERQEAHSEALKLVEQFGKELAEARVENGALEEQAALNQTESFFDLQERALQTQLARQNAKSLNALRSGEITYKEFGERRAELARQDQDARIALANQRLVEESALDAQLTEKLLEQAQARFDLQQEQRELEQAERGEELTTRAETGDLSPEELETGLAEAEALRQEQERAALIEHEEAKAEISQGFVIRGLERAEAAAADELKVESKKLKEIEKIERAKQQILSESTAKIGDAVGKFLSGQTKTFKDFQKQILLVALEALKKFILLSITQATVREVGTKGFIGIGTGAILTAVIQAAFTGVEAAVTSFESGGSMPTDKSGWVGGNVPATSGMIRGRRHSAGGIRRGGVEVEGGEYKLQNGSESYIVNRRSTAMFQPWLERLAADPGIYSPERRQTASAINAYSGFGVRFEQGGALGAAPAPLSAPLNGDGLIPFQANTGADVAAIRESSEQSAMLSRATLMLAEETNARIDRLEVVINPGRAVRAGSDQIEAESKRQL